MKLSLGFVLAVLLIVSSARAAQAQMAGPLCCTSAGGSCFPYTQGAQCQPPSDSSDPYGFVFTVNAQAAQTVTSSGPDNYGIAIQWLDGGSILKTENIAVEATGRDTSKPIVFCFNSTNPSRGMSENIHVVYTSEFAENFATPSGDICVSTTIDARFTPAVPALPRAGLEGLAGALAFGGCVFGLRGRRRRAAGAQ